MIALSQIEAEAEASLQRSRCRREQDRMYRWLVASLGLVAVVMLLAGVLAFAIACNTP